MEAFYCFKTFNARKSAASVNQSFVHLSQANTGRPPSLHTASQLAKTKLYGLLFAYKKYNISALEKQ